MNKLLRLCDTPEYRWLLCHVVSHLSVSQCSESVIWNTLYFCCFLANNWDKCNKLTVRILVLRTREMAQYLGEGTCENEWNPEMYKVKDENRPRDRTHVHPPIKKSCRKISQFKRTVRELKLEAIF